MVEGLTEGLRRDGRREASIACSAGWPWARHCFSPTQFLSLKDGEVPVLIGWDCSEDIAPGPACAKALRWELRGRAELVKIPGSKWFSLQGQDDLQG